MFESWWRALGGRVLFIDPGYGEMLVEKLIRRLYIDVCEHGMEFYRSAICREGCGYVILDLVMVILRQLVLIVGLKTSWVMRAVWVYDSILLFLS